MTELKVGSRSCPCSHERHEPRFVVLTGGPGAGKTAVLELARRALCRHVGVLPEAASIVFGGGFPRHSTGAGQRSAQRAIHHVQVEVERLVTDEARVGIALCDRGTLDGAAYWPTGADEGEGFWSELGTTPAEQLARYATVIHLRTPLPHEGYNHDNPLRVETAEEAHRIDERIADVWHSHPRLFTIDSEPDFAVKATRALELIRAELPPCCRGE